jgi:hypothetical protein
MLFGQYAGTMRNQSASLSGDHTMGRSQSLIPVVHSREFVVLRKGGEADRRAVSAVMLQAGRRWHGEDLDTGHLLRTQFMQG